MILLGDLLTVYRAEFVRRSRSRPFLIGLIIGALGIISLAKLPSFFTEHVGREQLHVIVAGEPALVARARQLLSKDYSVVDVSNSTAPPTAETLQAARAGRLVALRQDRDGLSVLVYSTDPGTVDTQRIARLLLPLNLEIAAHVDPHTAARLASVRVAVRPVGSRAKSAEQVEVQHGIAFSLIFLLYLLVILNSQLTMAGVIEEKTSRIAELLVAAVDPLALLYGKILAGATLGFLQMLVWLASAVIAGASATPAAASAVTNSSRAAFDIGAALQGALPPLVIVAFVFFLILGLLQFSTLFAGLASLISRPEDLGSVSAAMVLPIIAAFFIAIAALDAPQSPIVVVTSFIPLLAPFTMFARIAVSQPPFWQVLASSVLNVVAVYAIAQTAGRLYRVGMLTYGRLPNLQQVWNTIRG
ncbi:MAG: ABC transporter permease [Candidatus Eremiobacteraeota bacterium]|nr:ABC transporter permease [Candidatus Eremiobacteraeota bacterium]